MKVILCHKSVRDLVKPSLNSAALMMGCVFVVSASLHWHWPEVSVARHEFLVTGNLLDVVRFSGLSNGWNGASVGSSSFWYKGGRNTLWEPSLVP